MMTIRQSVGRTWPWITYLLAIACIAGCVDQAKPSAVREIESPLAVALGINLGNDGEIVVEGYEEDTFVAVRACMLGQGFEWFPEDVQETDPYIERDLTVDWAERYGLGVTTSMLDPEGLPPNLIGLRRENGISNGGLDRNAEYAAMLSPEDRLAYDQALYGSPDYDLLEEIEVNEGQAAAIRYAEEAILDGCAAIGVRNRTESQVKIDRLNLMLGDQLEDLNDRIASDYRLVEFDATAAECMSRLGYSFHGVDNLWADFYRPAVEITRLLDADGDRRIDDGAHAEEVARLADLQAAEIRFSLGLFECKADEKSLLDLRNEVRVEHEAEFVERNASVLSDIIMSE